MRCSRVERYLAIAEDHEARPSVKRRIELHLSACEACRAFGESLRQSREALDGLRREPLDPAVLDEVRRGALRAIETAADSRRTFTRPGLIWSFAAAAAAALLVLGLLTRNGERRAPETVRLSKPEAEQESRPRRTAAVPEPSEREAVPDETKRPPAPQPHAKKSTRVTIAQRSQPVTIKMLTDDPDVVIYWIIEPKEG